MAFNPNTGETTYNGRTYTPAAGFGARDAFRTVTHYADADGFPTGHDRAALLAAVRRFYRLPLDGPAFQIARTVIRGLRAENAPA
ncbi:hypothetical protein [Streptomyces canus]|uniref:hypothetical protein n=1 Tax=Streptomyces canus TaxID=58343 RepID=UPI002E259C09